MFRYVSPTFPEYLMLVHRCKHIKFMILHSIRQEKCSFCIHEHGLWRYLEYLKIEEKLGLRQYHNLFRYVSPTFPENFMLVSRCEHIKFMILHSIWLEKCSFCIYECGLWCYLEYLKIEAKLDLRQYHNLFRYVLPTFSENFMLVSKFEQSPQYFELTERTSSPPTLRNSLIVHLWEKLGLIMSEISLF